MYLSRPTWLEHGPRRGGALSLAVPVLVLGRRSRGFGAAPCPSVQQLQGIADASDPCQAPPASQHCDPMTGIDVSTGQFCQNLIVPMPSAPLPAGAAAGSSSFCLTPLFPWLGQKFAGACGPVFSVPSPWDLILTAGVVGLVVMKFSRGR